MAMMENFNRTLDYLESALCGEVDERKIERLSGYSYPMFRRIFSIMTEMTLSEYLRARKLTEAAMELRESEKKVIDIALAYGYESPDSFGQAFKSFHGYTPSEVRKGEPFCVVSRIRLKLSIKGGSAMKINIKRKPAFTVAGINFNDIESSLCSKVWQELFSKCSLEELAKLGTGQSYGVCHDIKDCRKINYMAAYDVKDVDKAKEMGLEVLEVEETEYAVVELQGRVPDCIHAGWKYLLEVFFPEQGYNHSGKPDFEVYGEGDMDRDDYKMQLWVPVVKEA